MDYDKNITKILVNYLKQNNLLGKFLAAYHKQNHKYDDTLKFAKIHLNKFLSPFCGSFLWQKTNEGDSFWDEEFEKYMSFLIKHNYIYH